MAEGNHKTMKPWVGISLMTEADFITSALPLFENEEVEVVEWSFDTIHQNDTEPTWLPILLEDYSKKRRLIGHGVRYSLLNGKWTNNQQEWLKQLSNEVMRYNYRHMTEHFGFMTSDNFHQGAPLPVPLTNTSLLIGQDRLKRIQQVTQLPVGIENLAFAFSNEQVKEQGAFLEKLIAPINGFLILDLHNIWSQAINFNIDPDIIIKSYPLDKVKEIHVSGGSWSTVSTSNSQIRRDTHDDAVPNEVFELLKLTLPLCKNTEVVIFERLGNTLPTKQDQLQFMADYQTLKHIVSEVSGDKALSPEIIQKIVQDLSIPANPIEDTALHEQQMLIIDILTSKSTTVATIKELKQNTTLQKNGWNNALWTSEMIETSIQLLQKWNC